ncbi:MAG TPA: UDP-N-acetylmuramoyl-L-alanyl-D-glutamate--2,6-diaminopimelate ligase [Myxococcota bacterium]|nr:UDP-N-acetylmuramoyl-L-alanyl-D-glutamate--2,6-diaminopimelate ligase [Myxococcota bacterium]HRY91899.1 UDP-N-acetylmuramoyl-L-alanyl-D-glutamate--2,6-diaminopimelate ligase [Myxococcota bacterium]HSA22513.1 UDP-N-acetylmuramoyl-L-alanyl-D-glutamate--2,6-diaminopimelate ligase [Myxococcota bacterium]
MAAEVSTSCSLVELLAELPGARLEGEPSLRITGVEHDSRQVRPGHLFVALPGQRVDGHAFLEAAAAAGAVAAVVEREAPRGRLSALVRVPEAREALARLAARFWRHPTRALRLVGVTGTNGKTTLTYLVEQVVRAAGGSPGVIGTVEVRFAGQRQDSQHTTPMATELQALFARMRAAGVSHAIMEVSSHALELQRVRGCDFEVAAFTNLSRDHLDFHGDLERYAAAKALLFSRELMESQAPRRTAVVNRDDERAERMLRDHRGPVLGFSRRGPADVCVEGPVHQGLDGIRARVRCPAGALELASPLTGAHNLENLLTAVAVACALELPVEVIQAGLAACARVPGRLERVPVAGGPAVFVDYAHTDDALRNVLGALRPLTRGRLWAIFGCGGDRDRGKRPLMGAAVARGADVAVVTSDNPRTEEPDAIIAQILPGLEREGFARCELAALAGRSRAYAVVPDRRAAIRGALAITRPEDVVLVAGKGHENYQIVGREKHDFDDLQEARLALEAQRGGRAE